MLSLAFLAGATLFFSLGSSTLVLLLARLLQGFSGAAVFTFGRTLLLDKVGQKRIGSVMGYTGTAMSVGLLIGPVIGGGLYEIGGPRAVFCVPIGMLMAEVILRALIVDGKRASAGYSANNVEGNSATGQQTGERRAKTRDPPTGASTDDGVDSEEGRHPMSENQPLLQKNAVKRHPFMILLLSPRFSATLLSSFILNGLANGFDAILPAYSRDELDVRSSQVALLFLLLGVPMILSPLAGYLTDKYGAKWPITGALVIMTPSLFLLRFVTNKSTHPFVALGVLLSLVGIAFSLSMPPLQAEITAVVKSIEEASPGIFAPNPANSQAYGLLNASFAAGAMIGPIFTGFVRVALGWQGVTFVMALLACLVLVLAVLMIGEFNHHANELVGAGSIVPDQNA